MKFFWYVFALLSLAGTLPGCAGGGVSVVTDPAELAAKQAGDRAVARWNAMIRKDFDTAYQFLSPGSKVANPISMFKAKIRPLEWRAIRVVEAACERDVCKVKLSLALVDKRLGGEVETVFEESWLQESGQWWLVFNQ